MKRFILVLISFALFAGCMSSPEPRVFIVQRDVPVSPTFAILSVSDYFGNKMEQLLIEYGIKVFVSPRTKLTETSQKDSKENIEQSIRQTSFDLITNADYVLTIDSIARNTYRIKIIKMKDREILTNFEFSENPASQKPGLEEIRFKATFYDAFKKMGLKVRDYTASYPAAVEYLKEKKLNIKSIDDWKNFSASENKPFFIPENPDIIYKNAGWISWEEWLKQISTQV